MRALVAMRDVYVSHPAAPTVKIVPIDVSAHARINQFVDRRKFGGRLKGRPQLADRAETADHIHKDATDRYAPCLRGGLYVRCYSWRVIVAVFTVFL